MNMQHFIKDTSGSVLAFTGLAFAMVLGSAAIAVDLSYAYVIKSRLQGTADIAAMVGTTELPDEADVRTRAKAYAALNMPAANHGTVLADADVTVGNWDDSGRVFTVNGNPVNAVRVVTRRSDDNGNPLGLFFGQLLGVADMNVTGEAIATSNNGPGSDCILTLNPDKTGVYVNSNADITTENCGIHANSTDDESIQTNGDGEITTNGADICTAGDYAGSGYSPEPTTGCDIKPDPMASLSPPPFGSCDHTEKVEVNDGETVTLSPGRYCKGLIISSGGTGIFDPGNYIIEGDKFTVSGDATAEGTGVSFYMGSKEALVLFNTNSHINLSAPTSGAMAGVLMYVDRDIDETMKHVINSDTASTLNGAVYMPESELLINSDGVVGSPGSCTNYVVGNLVVNSDSALYVGQDFDSCGVPLPRGMSNVRLVR